jgi:hypothetical protein
MTRNRKLRSEILDLHADLSNTCANTALALYDLEDITDDLLMWATHTVELYDEMAEDLRQEALGNTRVSCQWCDGSIYVERPAHGPYTCYRCRHCDGY